MHHHINIIIILHTFNRIVEILIIIRLLLTTIFHIPQYIPIWRSCPPFP